MAIEREGGVPPEAAELARLELGKGLSLLLLTPRKDLCYYPTDRLQKGWLLARGGRVLAEEGTGFGLPIARYGYQAVFPAEARISETRKDNTPSVSVTYTLALVERLRRKGGRETIGNAALYRVMEHWSGLHRRLPLLRRGLSALFDSLRRGLNLETTFEEIEQVGTVEVTSAFNMAEGRMVNTVDLGNLRKSGCTGVIVANEQGGSFFDLYQDSNGNSLEKGSISAWAETAADSASLVDRRDGVTFSLDRLSQARLYRGREMKAGRLAWAGLNYVLPPTVQGFKYEIRIAQR